MQAAIEAFDQGTDTPTTDPTQTPDSPDTPDTGDAFPWLAATLLGASVSQPGSPAFWLALGITAGVSVFSLLGYLLWQKRQKNKI